MKKIFFLLFLSLTILAEAQVKYPVTKKVDTVNDYHGEQVTDSYRGLEDDSSPATKEWLIAQNKGHSIRCSTGEI